MHTARAAGLWPAAEPHLFEQRPHFQRDAAEIGPGDARRGIEIDAELVRMIEIAGAHGMGMQFDAAEVHDEGQARHIVDHYFLRRASGRKGKRHGSEPLGARGGRPLLVERHALGAIDKSLQH
jgi:hypothetical protein